MPLYEGVVASLMADGRAEVVIRPGKPAIHGAPELTQKVCHCATNGSTVKTEALNGVGADVGDWVLLSRRAGVLVKNAVVLLGIPVIGAVSGLVAGAILFDGAAFPFAAMVVSAAVGLFLGLVVGVATYRRISVDDQPVIRRILRSRTDAASMPHGDPSSNPACLSKAGPDCLLSRSPRK
ncbi:MAG: SoxR reducing system RseC family protein [Thermodesulfobacteriota bacterium]|nr:SoxR reducing system RseC family protein [Thermodesulfobacteriota bacterium]